MGAPRQMGGVSPRNSRVLAAFLNRSSVLLESLERDSQAELNRSRRSQRERSGAYSKSLRDLF